MSIADGKSVSFEVDIAESMRLLLPPGSVQPRGFSWTRCGSLVKRWREVKNRFKTNNLMKELEAVWAFSLGIATVICTRGSNLGRKTPQLKAVPDVANPTQAFPRR